jgi:hypothetical protein
LRREGITDTIEEVKAMKKGIVVMLALCAAAAWGTNYDSTDAWAGASTNNPVNFTPRDLGTKGDNLTYNQRQKTFTDNGVWYTWTEPESQNYDWMMFAFDYPGEVETATLNWQVAIDHDTNVVHLSYWHDYNENWVWLAQNDGGREPPTEHTNVKAAYDNCAGEQVLFLFVGYTPAAGDNWVKCDVADVNATLD